MTTISWTDQTWNPVTGCTPISPACDHCYAKRMAHRLKGRYGYPDDTTEWSTDRGGCMVQVDHSFDVTLHPDKLDQPLRWRKPRRVFVVSMGDLFHKDVPDEFLDRVFAMMALASQHAFQVLTKRPERMREYVVKAMFDENCMYDGWYEAIEELGIPDTSPMQNVWLGVTAEDQQRADERIPILLDTPAAARFVSVEPMLGRVNLTPRLTTLRTDPKAGLVRRIGLDGRVRTTALDWVICGGETGPGARPMQPEWARSLLDQCQSAGVPFHMKQMSAKAPIPDDLMVREFPQQDGGR